VILLKKWFNSVNMTHKAAMSYGMKSKCIIRISSIVINQPNNMAKRFQTLNIGVFGLLPWQNL